MSALTRLLRRIGTGIADFADTLFYPMSGTVINAQQGVADEQHAAYAERMREMHAEAGLKLGGHVYVFDDPELHAGDLMARLTKLRHDSIRLQYDCERLKTHAAELTAEAGAMVDRLKAARDKIHLIEPVVTRK